MFDAAEEDDEESAEIGDVLEILYSYFQEGEFTAADIFAKLGDGSFEDPDIYKLRQFITLGGTRTCSPLYVGRSLKGTLDRPLRRGGGEVLILKARVVHNRNIYRIDRKIEGVGRGGLFD